MFGFALRVFRMSAKHPKDPVLPDRRNFLSLTAAGISSAWLTANFPSMLSAATHAHAAKTAAIPAKFEFFKPEEAMEVEAMASRIIPSDETPGAKEAGVIYFIDRALVTFASDSQSTYRDGLAHVQETLTAKFPGIKKFSVASPEQQDSVLDALSRETTPPKTRRGNRASTNGQPFFEVLRYHTIAGFLIDPDSDRRGNRDGVGWKVIGREPLHIFQPPFGELDKDYPGWQPVSGEAK
jgi:gluconate 2-dehydrogenase gamma chain